MANDDLRMPLDASLIERFVDGLEAVHGIRYL